MYMLNCHHVTTLLILKSCLVCGQTQTFEVAFTPTTDTNSPPPNEHLSVAIDEHTGSRAVPYIARVVSCVASTTRAT